MIDEPEERILSRMTSWPMWAGLVSGVVLWVLPLQPYYEEGLPYLYILGGPALLSWYLGLGCLSLGLYCLMDGLKAGWSRIRSFRSLLTGGGALFLAGGLYLLYRLLLELSVALP